MVSSIGVARFELIFAKRGSAACRSVQVDVPHLTRGDLQRSFTGVSVPGEHLVRAYQISPSGQRLSLPVEAGPDGITLAFLDNVVGNAKPRLEDFDGPMIAWDPYGDKRDPLQDILDHDGPMITFGKGSSANEDPWETNMFAQKARKKDKNGWD